jgi:hypothetical protein
VSTTPLVYLTSTARSQAERLLPDGTCVENEIVKAIREGRVLANRRKGRVLGASWTAAFERVPGRLRPPPPRLAGALG